MGVMVAFALYWPDAQIWIWGIFPVPAKVLITILVVVDLYGAVDAGRGDTVAHFAHLGGVVVAILYVKWWQPRHLNQWKSRASGKPASGAGGGLFGGPPPLQNGNPFLLGYLPNQEPPGQQQEEERRQQYQPRPRQPLDGWINRMDGG